MLNPQCKICRRLGTKLFLKSDRCLSSKCTILRKPDKPGPKRKRRPSPLSEYGKQLREKQRLKEWYNLREKQFKNYVKSVIKRGADLKNPADLLIKKLESRLDNVVLRLGFALSRPQARQAVSHGYFLVNGKPVNIPSFGVKKGSVISVRPQKIKKTLFQKMHPALKKYNPPKWLELNAEKFEGKVIGEPTLEETAPPAEMSTIFEFYSR